MNVLPRKLAISMFTASLLATNGVLAAEVDLQIEVVQRGIYDSRSDKTREAPELIASTTIVPAAVGTEFGFEFDARGADGAEPVELKLITEFPSQGIYDPETQKTVFSDERTFRPVKGFRSYRGYSLDSSSELVLGTWTFKIVYRDRVLATQSFVLVSP